MIDPDLKKLADSPINTAERANKLFLPNGTRPKPKGSRSKVTQDFDPNRLSRSQIEARKVEAHSEKIVKLLDYYAGTQTPFERIAQHMKMSLNEIEAAMLRRGRSE